MNDTDILISEFSGDALADALDRYYAGEPAAYIIGKWEFFGDVYRVTPDVLIPRCDTERTVEKLIEKLPHNGRFLDIGTGCGCIAVSALKRRPDAFADAVDVSREALEIAKENAELNGVAERVRFVLCDVKNGPSGVTEKYDVIVSNPPYIPSDTASKLDVYVSKEPEIALDGGKDGLDFYRAILSEWRSALKTGGRFLFEIGYDQKEKVEALAKELRYGSEFFRDYSSNWRVALITPE